MSEHRFSKAGVLGTGMMGPGIAAILAIGGVKTTIVSRTAEGAAAGLRQAMDRVAVLESNQLIQTDKARAARERLQSSDDLESTVSASDLFIESGPENMEWKQQLFARLDELAPPASVLATNTSGMSITAIASRAKHPERIVTTHFWNPPHLMPLVEVVKGEKTSDEVAHRVQTILTNCGKTAIVIQKDRPGQLGNRLQMALVREAANIIAEGIASAEDIDLTLKRGLGLRYPAYGLLEHQDLVGLEMGSAICEYVGRDLYRGEDLPQYMKTLVSSGRTGAASGQGFLTWPKGKAEEVKARRDAFLLGFLRSERGTDA